MPNSVQLDNLYWIQYCFKKFNCKVFFNSYVLHEKCFIWGLMNIYDIYYLFWSKSKDHLSPKCDIRGFSCLLLVQLLKGKCHHALQSQVLLMCMQYSVDASAVSGLWFNDIIPVIGRCDRVWDKKQTYNTNFGTRPPFWKIIFSYLHSKITENRSEHFFWIRAWTSINVLCICIS